MLTINMYSYEGALFELETFQSGVGQYVTTVTTKREL